jgi:hypothetical protein
MPLRRSVVPALFTATALVSLLLGPLVGDASASAPPQPPPLGLAPGSPPMTLGYTGTLVGGDTVTSWSGNGITVAAAAQPGSEIVIHAPSAVKSATAGVTSTVGAGVNPPPSLSGSNPTVLAQQYAASGRSVYSEALAVGTPPAVAASMAASLGVGVSGVSAQTSNQRGSTAPTITATTTGPIINSNCAYTSVDSGNIWGSACLVQRLLQAIPGEYYIGNQITTSGAAKAAAGGNRLVGLEGYYYWGNGYTYTRVRWAPSSSRYVGTSTTYTLTASYAGFGLSVPITQHPGTLTPEFPNHFTQAAFGSKWTRSNGNGTVDSANSCAIVHLGPGAPGDANSYVIISYT